jgi:Zn-dependent protease with chaperone function
MKVAEKRGELCNTAIIGGVARHGAPADPPTDHRGLALSKLTRSNRGLSVPLLSLPLSPSTNAGGGVFYVTTGLLEQAGDDQLRGVMAHEVAHADLGHVAKAQALGTGMNIGIFILDQIIPGSGYITPLVADLGVMRPFSRQEEYEADFHGVEILQRANYDGKQIMGNTLTWLLKTAGSSGGFFESHPGTGDRIRRIHALP